MKRTVYDCDGCAKKDVKTATIRFYAGICSGGPGPSETEYNYLDLCPECCGELASKVVDTLDDNQQQAFYSGAKAKR